MSRSQVAVYSLAAILFLLVAPSLATGAIVDLARTGQTLCYSDSGTVVPCSGTGQDGDILAGIAWPVRGGTIVQMPIFADGFESGSTDAWVTSP